MPDSADSVLLQEDAEKIDGGIRTKFPVRENQHIRPRGQDFRLGETVLTSGTVMQKQKSGAIINISTAWAFEPSAMFPTSAVFRAGLASFTKIFAETYAGDNIRMTAASIAGGDVKSCDRRRRDGERTGSRLL